MKKGTRERLFPGGQGVAPTDDTFMDEHLLITNKREQERAEEAQKRADNVAHKKIYADTVAKWKEKGQAFCDAGFPMSCAGDKLLLYQITAGNYSLPTDILANQKENSLKTSRERVRHNCVSIDLIAGEEIDLEDRFC